MMGRRPDAEEVWPIAGTGRSVRLKRPKTGTASWRVLFTDERGRPRELNSLDRNQASAMAQSTARRLSKVSQAGAAAAGWRSLNDLFDQMMGSGPEVFGWKRSYVQDLARARQLLPNWFLRQPVDSWDVHMTRRVMAWASDTLGHEPGSRQYQRLGALLATLAKAGRQFGYVALDRGSPLVGITYQQKTIMSRRNSSVPTRPPIVGSCGSVTSPAGSAAPLLFPPLTDRRSTIPVLADIDRYAQRAASLTADGRWGVHGRVLAFTGVREAESLHLSAADLYQSPDGALWFIVWRQLVEVTRQFGDGQSLLTNQPTKNKKWRFAWVPDIVADEVHDLAHQALARHPDKSPEEVPLFPAPRGGYYAMSNWRERVFDKTVRSLDWPREPKGSRNAVTGYQRVGWRWPPHSFRHFAATWMIRDLRIDPDRVAAFLGHGDAGFTEEVYVDPIRVNGDGLRNAEARWRRTA